MAVSGLICPFPNINKTHTRMKPIKHAQRGSDMTKNSPKDFAIVVVSQVVNPRVLYGEGLEDPRGDIEDHEEGDQLSTWLDPLQLPGVAASSQGVCDEGSLYQHLKRLQEK